MMNDVSPVGWESPVGPSPDGGDWDTAARVVRLLGVVQQFAVLDFSETAPVDQTGDDLDALAAGINMLGEELGGWNADFKQRVEQRTVELTASAELLEAEVLERRRAETQLEETNADLNGKVAHLRRLNEQIGQLAELSSLLQTAEDLDDAFDALGRYAPAIFTETGGAIYVGTGDEVQRVATWGPQRASLPATLGPDLCLALRPGAAAVASGIDRLRCGHLHPDVPDRTLCVPLTAQGETLGLLSLHCRHSPSTLASDGWVTGNQDIGLADEGLAVAVGEQFTLSLTNLSLRAELRAQSIRDALTGLHNRRYLDETLSRELHRADRADGAVSVLMLDVDHFKDFNDTYGHAAGDAVLAHIAGVLLDSTRTEDIACRFGGEEFAVIMVGIGQTEAGNRAEQIRASIARSSFTWDDQPTGQVTVSIGVSTRPQHGTTPDRLLASADAAMYRAKAGGRNRVEPAR